MNYYKKQLEQLSIDGEYSVTVKFFGITDTNHLSLNSESIPHIINYLEGYVARKEATRLAKLIDQKPADVELLKQEYEQLTGKRYYKKK